MDQLLRGVQLFGDRSCRIVQCPYECCFYPRCCFAPVNASRLLHTQYIQDSGRQGPASPSADMRLSRDVKTQLPSSHQRALKKDCSLTRLARIQLMHSCLSALHNINLTRMLLIQHTVVVIITARSVSSAHKRELARCLDCRLNVVIADQDLIPVFRCCHCVLRLLPREVR